MAGFEVITEVLFAEYDSSPGSAPSLFTTDQSTAFSGV